MFVCLFIYLVFFFRMCEYNFKMQLQRSVQEVQYLFSLDQYLISVNQWFCLNIFISRRIHMLTPNTYMTCNTLLLYMYQYLIPVNLWFCLNIFISRRIHMLTPNTYMTHCYMYLHMSLIIWHCLIVTRNPHAEHVYTLHDSHMYSTYWSHVHHMLTICIQCVLDKSAPHDDHMYMYPTCWTYSVHVHILLANHKHTPNI